DPEVPVGPPSPVAEEVEDSQADSIPVSETNHDDINDDDDGDIGDNDDIDNSDDGSDNEDEAESLVLARVIKTPTPGDLFLDERLLNLTHDLERKTHQMAIVRALMRQAQSRHRAHEQRVLRASFKGLRREVHAEMEQQRQYECVLADHTIVPGRTRVHIPRAVASPAPAKASAAAGDGDHARDAAGSHVVYLIELQQSLPPEYTHNYNNNNTISGSAMMTATTPTTGWVVARRYREFFAMHQKLKQTHPDAMRLHELPARTPLIRLQKDRDIEHRRLGLEKYLQGVLREAQVCNTRAVRLFLSSCEPPSGTLPVSGSLGKSNEGGGGGWMEQIFKTVGKDIEGITGADSMLEIIVQELGAQVAMQHSESTSQAAAAADSSAAFIDPLSDVFIEVFGLKNRRNWLRRQAISILLRHIVGGTVERRIRLMLTSFVTSDPQLSQLLCQLRTSMWPDNQKFRAPAKRSAEQRSECRARARRQILGYVPRVLGNMVGRKNAQEGARLVFDAMQYDCVGLNLALSVFDAVVCAVFPEIKFQLE
ncbi:tRNA (guanine-N(7)-)-methyltransferase (tRNA(m7G46)-methyltransferase), partial [Coemansia erecta]